MIKLGRFIHNTTIQYRVKLLLAVILSIILLGSFPTNARAQDIPIDLVLSGEGAVSWNIENVKPGDTGSKIVTLQNAGLRSGIVTIWLSDVVSLEGTNQESESGDTSEPGELVEYLILDLSSGAEIDTNLVLPTKISEFPKSVVDAYYIRIGLEAGSTITIDWHWELPWETGNIVQGDSLSFTINYLLEEIPGPPSPEPPTNGSSYTGPPGPEPPSPEPPGPEPPTPEPPSIGDGDTGQLQIIGPEDILVYTDPGLGTASNITLGTPTIINQVGAVVITNDAPYVFALGTTIVTWTVTDINGNKDTDIQIVTVIDANCYFDIDVLGEITRVRVNCSDNSIAGFYEASDPYNQLTLEIESGTVVVCGEYSAGSSYPKIIVINQAEEPMPVPDGLALVGRLYRFTGYQDNSALDSVCPSISFSRPVSITVEYDPNELPYRASSIFIARYNEEESTWMKLAPVEGEADIGGIAEVGKSTGITQYFSLFAVMAEVPSSTFLASGLTITPTIQSIGIGGVTFIKKVGESVGIVADVANDSEQENYYDVYLKINGYVKDIAEVGIGPQQSQKVVFIVTDNEPGNYIVQIGTLIGDFQTWIWINWWLIGGLLGALVLLCCVIWFYLYRWRRRRMKPKPRN